MDAFGVVGFVSNILQLVSSAHNVLSLAKQVHSSTIGLAPAIEQLRLLVEDVRSTVADITNRLMRYPPGEFNRLQCIAEECIELSQSLLQRFERLQTKNHGWQRKVESFKNAVIFMYSKEEINETWIRLQSLTASLNRWWDAEVNRKQTSFIEQHLKKLTVKIDWIAEFQELKRQMAELFKQISHLSSAVEVHEHVVEQQNQGLRSVLLNDLVRKLAEFRNLLQLVEKRNAIIASLLFETMKTRFNRIEHSYPETLDWIFATKQANFRKWLETGDGIYWISGLAGSGKSTLMKYLVQNQATNKALSCWAAPTEKAVSASYFFDNSGTPLQKSQLGLLQTILYAILRDDPSLVDIICPDHWLQEPWGMEELTKVFDLLITHQQLKTKFCFFIDGLDEYDGNKERAVQRLQSLTSSPSIKICVSSRPWSCFLRAWGDSELRIELQGLTREDITRYVHDKLTGNVKKEGERNSKYQLQAEQSNWLVKEVSQRSKGVWLWVYLVVQVLSGDIKDCEPFEQLRNRLEAIPTDLFQFFEKIFQQLDPYYKGQRAQIMLLAINAYQPLPVLILGSIPIDKVATDPYRQIAEVFKQTNFEGLAGLWKRRLHNRCGDLMTITWDSKVDFIHRSVREYLVENYLDILYQAAPDDFDSHLYLCYFMTAYVEASRPSSIRELLYYAKKIDARKEDAASNETLWHLLKRLESIEGSWQRKYWDDFELDDYNSPFMSLLIGHGLTHQTLLTFDRSPGLLEQSSFPYLAYPLGLSMLIPRPLSTTNSEGENTSADPIVPNLELVAGLLSRGADPNQALLPEMGGYSTIWVYFLLFCYASWPKWAEQPSTVDRITQTIECLIKYGADVTSVLVIEESTWNHITESAILPEMNALDLLAMFVDPETMIKIRQQVLEVSKSKQKRPDLSWYGYFWSLFYGQEQIQASHKIKRIATMFSEDSPLGKRLQ
ncbi:hypothetical protein F4803DRAFT_538831 [Xylaria telfairii]|nr:hypothetical protein F4803DRAFT_538831 [Xylaria telfairii]